MRVFADTSGLFAALVRNDLMHASASATLKSLLGRSVELVTTSYVLIETMGLLHGRVGPDAARRFDSDLRPLLAVTWVDLSLHSRAIDRYGRSSKKSVSLVDCSAFVLMEEEHVALAFGYDHHFVEEGFRLVRQPADLRFVR